MTSYFFFNWSFLAFIFQAFINLASSYQGIRIEEPLDSDESTQLPSSELIIDSSRTIISSNDSPDVPFESSLNPYRGCEHGCPYCYARPTHEYLGFSSGLDFETKILVKKNAPKLLEKALSSSQWSPKILGMSGVTDPYQPIEREFRISRKCLEVLLIFRNPVMIITKNALVRRDLDLLKKLNQFNAVTVFISLTTLDHQLSGILEPRASRPRARLEIIKVLSQAKIPTGVLLAPMIPGLTDMEIPKLVEISVGAGAQYAGMIPIRLPYSVASIFENWLEEHLPGKKKKILNRIRAIRGGKLNDPSIGSRMKGSGLFAEQMSALFRMACKKNGILGASPYLTTEHFRNPFNTQMTLF